MIWGRFFRYQPIAEPQREPPPTDRMQLAEHAKRLLDDPVLNAAFAAVERKLRDTWAASAPDDTAGRERVHAELRALGRVRGELQLMLGDAKVLEAEQKAAEQRRAA